MCWVVMSVVSRVLVLHGFCFLCSLGNFKFFPITKSSYLKHKKQNNK